MEVSNILIVLVGLIVSIVGYNVTKMDKKIDKIDEKLDRHDSRIGEIEKECAVNHSGQYDEHGRKHARRRTDAAHA